MKATEPHLLEVYTPEITKAYITSRLDSVAIIQMDDGMDDPLDDTGMVQQQLDQVGDFPDLLPCVMVIRLKLHSVYFVTCFQTLARRRFYQ